MGNSEIMNDKSAQMTPFVVNDIDVHSSFINHS